MPRPFSPSRPAAVAASVPASPDVPPAVGRPITLVVDHLAPETARGILAIFDRQRGAPLAPGQLLDLHNALDLLPHGSAYALLIGVWSFLPPAAREAWMAEGRAHVHKATAASVAAPPAAPATVVTRERRGRRGRVVLNGRGAFGRERGAR